MCGHEQPVIGGAGGARGIASEHGSALGAEHSVRLPRKDSKGLVRRT